MKPEFMKRIELSFPKIEEIKEIDADTCSIQASYNTAIQVVENFDNAIVEKIKEIAQEMGVNSLMLLNKHEIAFALAKEIPEKPKVPGLREGREINTVSYTCPMCNEHIGRDRYCKHCGQALDWSDTE